GKTWAILQWLLVQMISNDGLNVTVVRKTIPSLKRTVIKDFIDILKVLDIWREADYNISDRIWTYYNSTIQFISTDDAEKLRGIKSDILFIDEASEIDEESFFQLSIRTSGRIILAYNPTVSPYHWLRQMKDCGRYVTTYKDNTF
ncbi:MAG: phage terminase large subunit, partial [bacterium]